MKTFGKLLTFCVIVPMFFVCNMVFAVGSISGIVYYRGPKDGNIYVNAYDNQQYQEPPAYQTVINDTGPYIIPNMANGYYWLRAFMDADSNHQCDPEQDPDGFPYYGNPILIQNSSAIAVDILLDYDGTLEGICFHVIKLSSSIQAAWPGTKDFLCWYQVYADHNWDPEYIDSVWTSSVAIEGWGGKMYDDGLHWDGKFCDSVFGRYEQKDSAEMHIWQPAFMWDRELAVTYTPWLGGYDCQIDAISYYGILSIPILIAPEFGDTINNLQPQFIWHRNAANRYEIIIWDTMPMPNSLGENIIWRNESISGNDTTISMSQDTIRLEQGEYYYWALISHAEMLTPHTTDAMEWAQFYVDTNYVGVNEEISASISQPVIRLFQNYPNPFSKTTLIKYTLSSKHYAENEDHPAVRIYDAVGRLIKQFLLPTACSLLPTTITWDATGDDGKKVASGVYFYKLKTPGFSQIRKMIFIKP